MREMSPAYWLDLFTGRTWDEFRSAGAAVSGFRRRSASVAQRIKPGDIFLCYVTGVKRWVGALEVIEPTSDNTRIWADDVFPIRFSVRALILLDAVNGIPLDQLEGKVAFFSGPAHRGKYQGFFRSSPTKFEQSQDAELILSLLRQAVANPISRPMDERAYRRRPDYLLRGRHPPSHRRCPARPPSGPLHVEVEPYPDRL